MTTPSAPPVPDCDGCDRGDDPIERFRREFQAAASREPFDASRAALATVTPRGRPAVRFVLVKSFGPDGFVFFTNYESAKARDLAARPHAALVFHWHTTGVQVRVTGPVTRLSEASSDAYFATRPRGSRIGAWASPQSRPIPSREALIAEVAAVERRFADKEVPRPPFWGGYAVAPEVLEFWYDRPDRLHDRFRYQRTASGGYVCTRLAP